MFTKLLLSTLTILLFVHLFAPSSFAQPKKQKYIYASEFILLGTPILSRMFYLSDVKPHRLKPSHRLRTKTIFGNRYTINRPKDSPLTDLYLFKREANGLGSIRFPMTNGALESINGLIKRFNKNLGNRELCLTNIVDYHQHYGIVTNYSEENGIDITTNFDSAEVLTRCFNTGNYGFSLVSKASAEQYIKKGQKREFEKFTPEMFLKRHKSKEETAEDVKQKPDEFRDFDDF